MENELIKAVEELDEKAVLKLSKEGLEQGLKPSYIQKIIQNGMERVGMLYEKGEYYIADLIMAGIIFTNVLKIKEMNPSNNRTQNQKIGKLLLGTAKNDLHDIGKKIFCSMMEAAGFEVLDLGVDVSPETFVKQIMEYKPHVVGISGALSITLDSMKETVEAITKANLREHVKIILGGLAVKNGADFIGADAITVDSSIGVKMGSQHFFGQFAKPLLKGARSPSASATVWG